MSIGENAGAKLALAIGMVIAAMPAQQAVAASATSNFNVKVTITVACTVTAADLSFGSFAGSIPANTVASTAAVVSCNKGTPYAVSFATGAAPANATVTATANMLNGGNPAIPANLSFGATPNGGVATGGNDSTPISGKINGGAVVTNPAAGTYTVPQAIYVLY